MKEETLTMRSIRTKLLLAIVVLVASALTLVTSIGAYLSRQAILSEVEGTLEGQVAARAAQIDQWLKARQSEMTVLANTPQLRSGDQATQMTFLKAMASSLPEFNSIWLSDPAGNWVSIADTSGSIADRAYYPAARDGKMVISDPLVGRADGKLATVIAVPVKDAAGKMIGILGGNLSMQAIQDVVGSLTLGETGYAFLADGQGNLAAHPDSELITQGIREVHEGALAEVADRMLSLETGAGQYTDAGVQKLVAFAPIDSAGWSIAFSVPQDEVLAVQGQLLKGSFWAALISLVIAGAVALVIPREIIKPIHRIREQLEEIAKGGGDLTREVQVNTKDETGQLAEAFNAFLRTMRGMIQQVAGSAELVASSATQMGAMTQSLLQSSGAIAESASRAAEGSTAQAQTAHETTDVVDQLRAAIEQIATGAQEQAKESQATAEQVARMVHAVEEVIEKAQHVEASSQGALQSASDGGAVIQSTIDGMGRIRLSSQGVAQELQELSGHLQQIGSMAEVITGIAEQTNLLALNAAIEAARAGEHGRGFAVVAEEVRKLAEKAGSSAGDIAGLTDQILAGTRRVTQAVEEEAREIQAGSQSANEAQQALEGILQGARQTLGAVEEIVAAAKAIGEGSREVARAMDSVAAVSEENTASTEEMAAGADEVTRSVLSLAGALNETAAMVESISMPMQEMSGLAVQMNESTKRLNQAAEELQRQVVRFKV